MIHIANKCPVCGSRCDTKPFVSHVKSHVRKNELPGNPPEPSIYGNEEQIKDKRKAFAKMKSEARLEAYLKAFSENGTYDFETSVKQFREAAELAS